MGVINWRLNKRKHNYGPICTNIGPQTHSLDSIPHGRDLLLLLPPPLICLLLGKSINRDRGQTASVSLKSVRDMQTDPANLIWKNNKNIQETISRSSIFKTNHLGSTKLNLLTGGLLCPIQTNPLNPPIQLFLSFFLHKDSIMSRKLISHKLHWFGF